MDFLYFSNFSLPISIHFINQVETLCVETVENLLKLTKNIKTSQQHEKKSALKRNRARGLLFYSTRNNVDDAFARDLS